MKTSPIFLFALFGCAIAFGQTNTFPASGYVGIGTTTPSSKFHVYEGSANGFYDPYTFSLIEGMDARLQLLSTDAGNHGSSIILTNETSSWTLQQRTSTSGNRFDIGHRVSSQVEDIVSRQNIYLSIFNDGDVGIGTTDTKGFKLGVNGRIAATEVKVANYTNWADFVFEKDYDLPTLEEVEGHIKAKGHLKDIPSAKEVAENGIFLGEMDSKLLQKIEELTLYTIAQEKRIQHLEKENESLKSIAERMEKIEALLKVE
ncbi:hypothetical protein [Ulvibacterium sp.]|uniref:hypothetical protein n=1 Tax=Ulvibacterium sp. TaxID=2665914 RepID=UPI003BA9C9D1